MERTDGDDKSIQQVFENWDALAGASLPPYSTHPKIGRNVRDKSLPYSAYPEFGVCRTVRSPVPTLREDIPPENHFVENPFCIIDIICGL